MSEDGFWRDLWVIWFARGLCCSVLPAALEAVAFAVHLQDVDVVGGRSSNPPVSRSEPKISVHSSKDRLVLTMMDPRSSMISRLNQYSCRVSWADALRYRDPSIRAPSWTLRISSGISEGICNTMVQSGGEFLYIGVGGR